MGKDCTAAVGSDLQSQLRAASGQRLSGKLWSKAGAKVRLQAGAAVHHRTVTPRSVRLLYEANATAHASTASPTTA